jgi:homer protein
LHAYKEENQRLKVRLQELENSKGGGGSMSGSEALTDDLRREITLLKSRIEGLEKELMNQEQELKAAKVSLKDKNNDPMVKNLSSLFQQFSLHLGDLQTVQKEMDKLFQLHKTT